MLEETRLIIFVILFLQGRVPHLDSLALSRSCQVGNDCIHRLSVVPVG